MTALLLFAAYQSSAQNSIRVEAPGVVAVNEQFNVTFIIEGDKKTSDFSWSQGDDFQLVWGPQKGTSTSVQIINGKRTSSHQTTYTYILLPKAKGTFKIPPASATVDGERISSSQVSIQVVTDASSAPQGGQSGQGNQGSQSQGSEEKARQQAATGEIPSEDLFLRLSLSRSEVVIGEPITASLKLYQRVNIAGFENVKFPTFNGFWSQETYSPTNIEFKRESFDDKIYNTAVLRSYVLIPQQAGTITIDPAELVCLVNVRVNSAASNLSLIVVSIARPRSSSKVERVDTEGIDIVLAMDVSTSMLARDFTPDRISAAKDIAIEFISQRPTDRMGIVVFAGESYTQCPLTTDRATLINLMKEISTDLIEDGTAIGNGLATAVARMKDSDAKSRVVILLTDGVNNSGEVSPETAAEIAKTYGIRVYTIGVGANGEAPYPMMTPWGVQVQNVKVEIDEKLLSNIASVTGGRYFRATDNTKLSEIYSEINKMEKARTTIDSFPVYKELFGGYALAALICLILEMLVKLLVLRRLP